MSVGKALRDARTERGVDLAEAERATKIRVRFLQAMEENRWEELPAPAYARGFLTSYARYLGLDEAALLDQYRRATGDEDRPEPISPEVFKPLGGRRRRSRRSLFGRSRSLKPAVLLIPGGLLAAVLLALVIVGSVGGDGDDDDGSGERGRTRPASAADETRTSEGTTGGSTTAAAGSSPTPATTVQVELRSTAPVWVCLVDGRGRTVVNGETLTTGERRGPFDGPLFAVTFGNGSVEMTVDGEQARIPAVAEPLGFRISPSGVRELEPSSQPTCA